MKNSVKDFKNNITSILQTHFILPLIIRMRKSGLPLSLFSLPVIEKRKWTPAGKAILREELKKKALTSVSRVLLLRGPEQGMVNDVYEVLKEMYPNIEVVMLVGDKRKTDGFKGSVLNLFHEKNYFLRFFLEIFRKFDIIFVLRKGAILKKMLAILSLPKASFTIDNYGRLERIHFLG